MEMIFSDGDAGAPITKSKKKQIASTICGHLNSADGKFQLHFPNTSQHVVDSYLKIIEQHVAGKIGTTTMTSNIRFDRPTPNLITINIKKLDSTLITVNYNLYLPSPSQVLSVPATERVENIRKILGSICQPERMQMNIQMLPQEYYKGRPSDVGEWYSRQFKNLKSAPSNCVKLVDRMAANKLLCYVSAFANYHGGCICYGITDDGTVEGERLGDHEKDDITKQVTKMVNKMIWPTHTTKPERGTHWDISFRPVKDDEHNEIPDTFVIVIAVAKCPGGVFTEEPESYHIVGDRVIKMSFLEWKRRFLSEGPVTVVKHERELVEAVEKATSITRECSGLKSHPAKAERALFQLNGKMKEEQWEKFTCPGRMNMASVMEKLDPTTPSLSPKQALVPSHISPVAWTSETDRRCYRELTAILVQHRNDSNEKQFTEIVRREKEEHTANRIRSLAVRAEEVGFVYKKGHFHKAYRLLHEFSEFVRRSGTNISIFTVCELFLRSSIERARRNFQESYTIAQEGLQLLQLIPAEVITVRFYMHAAMLCAILSRSDGDSHKMIEAREYLALADRDSKMLDDFSGMADLEQNLRIFRAFLSLGCSPACEEMGPKYTITPRDRDLANSELSAVYSSKLNGNQLSLFRNIQFRLVKSDLFYEQYQAEVSDDKKRRHNLLEAFKFAKKAQVLASKKNFCEQIIWANNRIRKITVTLLHELPRRRKKQPQTTTSTQRILSVIE